MVRKRSFQAIAVILLLPSIFGSAGSAHAWYCGSYITVQWGDTLSGIAAYCGTTVAAIQSANPGLGSWVYAGQALYVPGGSDTVYYPQSYNYSVSNGTYVVQWGDTLGKIAQRANVSVGDLLAANPSIWNPSFIYVGQVIYIPAAPTYYTIQSGDTMRVIADRFGTTVYGLQLLNPQVYNINWIYPGQVLRVH